jgi:hypothetical protein
VAGQCCFRRLPEVLRVDVQKQVMLQITGPGFCLPFIGSIGYANLFASSVDAIDNDRALAIIRDIDG